MNRGPRGLIVYGTSFGATKGTSEEIARILREENFDIKIVNAQEEKVKDISEYELVIVGSSLARAREIIGDSLTINDKLCMGCGLCVTKCPTAAIRLVAK